MVSVWTLIEVFDQAALKDVAECEHEGDDDENGEWHGPVLHPFSHRAPKPMVKIGHLDFERISQEVFPGLINLDVAELKEFLHGNRNKRPDHEQRAMRKVDDTQSAENQGKSKGDQGISRALIQTVENLKNKCVHRTSPILSGG